MQISCIDENCNSDVPPEFLTEDEPSRASLPIVIAAFI